MNKRIDKASRIIHAPSHIIYAAFATQGALQSWLPPNEMEGEVMDFNFREDGGYRMRLTYTTDEHTSGKTTENSDEVTVQFVQLFLDERIEQVVTFDSEQEEFEGQMKMTWSFEEQEDDTDTLVTVTCTNVPVGIRPEDHEIGLNSSLKNLAEFVEKNS